MCTGPLQVEYLGLNKSLFGYFFDPKVFNPDLLWAILSPKETAAPVSFSSSV